MAHTHEQPKKLRTCRLLALGALSVALGFSQADDCATFDRCQELLKTDSRNSLAHFRIAELYFLQGKYMDSANEFRESLNYRQPPWIEAWSRVNLGKIYDIAGQRERALNEYRQAIRTKDNTRGALDEASKYIEAPYQRN